MIRIIIIFNLYVYGTGLYAASSEHTTSPSRRAAVTTTSPVTRHPAISPAGSASSSSPSYKLRFNPEKPTKFFEKLNPGNTDAWVATATDILRETAKPIASKDAIPTAFKDDKFIAVNIIRCIYDLLDHKNVPKRWTLPDEGFINAWLSASQKHMRKMDHQGLSNSLYALSHFGIKPSEEWMNLWYANSIGKMGSFNHQELSNAVFALHNMGFDVFETPAALAWMRKWNERSLAELRFFNTNELSNTLLVLSEMGAKPSQSWFSAWYIVSISKMDTFTMHELCNALYALSDFEINPTDDIAPTPIWLGWWEHASIKHMPHFGEDEFYKSLLAFSKLNFKPSDAWMNMWYSQCMGKLASMNHKKLCCVLEILSALGLKPNMRFTAHLNRTLQKMRLDVPLLAARELHKLHSFIQHMASKGTKIPFNFTEAERMSIKRGL